MRMMTQAANDMYASFVSAASAIKGFKPNQKNDVEYDIDKLADAYCNAFDSGDEEGKSKYSSALMVRYWHMVPFLFRKYGCIPHFEVEDAIGLVWDGISTACRYRGWRDPKQAVYGKRNGPEKCINQCITTEALMMCRRANAKSRRTDFVTVSYDALDDALRKKGGSDGDATVLDKLSLMASTDGDEGCADAVISSISKRSVFDALVAESISYGDCCVRGENGAEAADGYSISPKKLLDSLVASAKDDGFRSRFSSLYGIPKPEVDREADAIASMKRKPLAEAVMGATRRMFENDEVYEALCC